MTTCPGPLIWFDATPSAAIVECATCGYACVTGSLLDDAHADAPLLREGLAA